MVSLHEKRRDFHLKEISGNVMLLRKRNKRGIVSFPWPRAQSSLPHLRKKEREITFFVKKPVKHGDWPRGYPF